MLTEGAPSGVLSEWVQVCVRQRPPLGEAVAPTDGSSTNSGYISQCTDTSISYTNNLTKKSIDFTFHKVFGSSATQDSLFHFGVKDVIQSTMNGYNGTIIAYGPTNSGKTYTMRGDSDNFGIIPRAISSILELNNNDMKTVVTVSYLQIYCEVITDLINPTSDEPLTIREKPNGTLYIENISKIRLTSLDDIYEILNKGDINRSTAKTVMNSTSSRSHAIMMVTVTQPDLSQNNQDIYKESTLTMVDLAGSERYSATIGLHYQRSEEGKAINLSLSALGNCMNALAESRPHVPYRDSKLTRLLQNSLGGNARTVIICNIPPGYDEYGEIVNTLRFATRAMKVKVQAKISRIMNYELLYTSLLKQMEAQKEEISSNTHCSHDKKQLLEEKDAEIEALISQIKALQLQLDTMNRLQHLQEEEEGGKERKHDKTAALSDDTHETGNSVLYRDEIKHLSEQHLIDLDQQRSKYESRIANYLRTINDLKNEVNTLHDDVQSERQRHLATVQSMRGYHTKIEQLESSNNDRTQELLDELQEKMLIIEDMKDALGVSSELIKTVTENAENEHKRASELSSIVQTMYSKEQVKDIEVKFMDFITKLTNRVNQLEDTNKNLPVPIPRHPIDGLVMSSNNRDIKLEPGGRVIKVTSKKL